jgi:hypothetical protein
MIDVLDTPMKLQQLMVQDPPTPNEDTAVVSKTVVMKDSILKVKVVENVQFQIIIFLININVIVLLCM